MDYEVGSAATTSAPTILFNRTTSFFSWDADGTGPTAPVAFARYDPGSTVFWIASVDVGSHPVGWLPAGTGDFNADGTSDLAWYNSTTNNIDIWLMKNGQWAGSVDLGSHPAGWTAVGVGDFDHNGVSDIMWFNPSTGHIDNWMIGVS